MFTIEELISRSDRETALALLLCRIYLGTEREEALARFMDLHGSILDLNRLYLVLKRNRLRPVAYKVITANRFLFGAGFVKRLQQDCLRLTTTAFKNTREMARIMNLLQQQGIDIIPYRGPVFSKLYFGDWAMREPGDLDFLIRESDLPRIFRHLQEEGYKTTNDISDYRIAYGHVNTLSLDMDNDSDGQRNIHLEFHYNIIASHFRVSGIYDQFIKQVKSFDMNGQAIRVLSDEASMNILLAHHGVQDLWTSLKYYMDIAILVKNGATDVEAVREFTSDNGFFKLASAGFRNMELLTGVPHPFPDAETCAGYGNRLLDLGLNPDAFRHRSYYKLRLRFLGRDDLRWRLKMLRSIFISSFRPAEQDIQWIYFPEWLFPLYYLFRPLRLFYRFYIVRLWDKKAPAFPLK